MACFDELLDVAEGLRFPENPDELKADLEGLPSLFEVLSQRLHSLAEFLSQEGVFMVGQRVEEVSVAAGSAQEAAAQAFLELQESFWMRG